MDAVPCSNSPNNVVISLAPTAAPTVTATPSPTPLPSCSVRGASGSTGAILVSVDYSNFGSSVSASIQCGNGRDATGVSCSGGACRGSCAYPSAGRFTAGARLNDVACSNSPSNVVVSQPVVATVSTPSPTPATVAGAPEGASPASTGLLESLGAPQQAEANISVSDLATSPSVILENVQTRASAMVSSDQPITGVTCDSPTENSESLCNCELTEQNSNGNETTYSADCVISPPVRGRYVVVFTNAAGATKTAELTLTPGEAAELRVIQRGQDLTFWALAAIALMLFAGGVYLVARKLEEIVTYKEKLIEKKGSLLNDMKMLKYRLMKRELDDLAYKKAYDLKQKELAEVEARIAECLRKEGKPPQQRGELGL